MLKILLITIGVFSLPSLFLCLALYAVLRLVEADAQLRLQARHGISESDMQ